jgi:hypothetical protein
VASGWYVDQFRDIILSSMIFAGFGDITAEMETRSHKQGPNLHQVREAFEYDGLSFEKYW